MRPEDNLGEIRMDVLFFFLMDLKEYMICFLRIWKDCKSAWLGFRRRQLVETVARGGGFLVLLVFDGNRLTPKQRRDGGGLGQQAQCVLYQLPQRQRGRLQPFLLWFIVCWTNVNCFHHWQLCERSDVPSFTPCLPLNVRLCPYAIPHNACLPPHSTLSSPLYF